jgi:hypothetical protein
MAAINLPMAASYQPLSFVERGVDAPFTAPLLAGARMRGNRQAGLELVMPNPAGSRGVYVLPWTSARSRCSPTMHDLRLYEELRRLPALDPAAVRLAARTVAAEGLAGAAAQTAAGAAAAEEAALRRQFAAVLWMGARSAVLPGVTAAVAARDIDAIAALFVPLGLQPSADAARLPRVQAGLEGLRIETDIWARANAGDELSAVAGMISAAAAATAAVAARMLHEARGLAVDLPALLRQWQRAPDALAALLGRAEWVLNGWDRLVLLWQEAKLVAAQRGILLEMSQLVPDLPVEAAGWMRWPPEALQPVRGCRVLSLSEGWRTGGARFGLIARNERMRARCV